MHSFVHGDVVPNSWALAHREGLIIHPLCMMPTLSLGCGKSSLLTMCGTVWFSAFAARVTWLLTSPRSSLLVGQSTVLNKDVCHGCGTAGPTTL